MTNPSFGTAVIHGSLIGGPVLFEGPQSMGKIERPAATKMIVNMAHISVKVIQSLDCTIPDRISISAMKLPNGGNPSSAKMPTANNTPENGSTLITPLSAATSLVP